MNGLNPLKGEEKDLNTPSILQSKASQNLKYEKVFFGIIIPNYDQYIWNLLMYKK